MAPNPIRRVSLIASLALLAPLAGAQKPASQKPQSAMPALSSVTLPGPTGGGFLTGTDDCATPTPVAGVQVVNFDQTAATTGTAGQNETNCYFFATTGIETDVWWCWTPGFTGTARITTCNTSATDTKCAVYPGCGCPADGTSIACNDDACGLQTTVDFPAVAATTYTVQLGTFPGAGGGNGTVSFGQFFPPAGDTCGNPTVLPGVGVYNFDLTTATDSTQGQNETLCYAFGTSGIQNDLWYTFNATCDADATLTTCGLTTTDTKVAVYPGVGCPADGSSIACNDDACGLQSTVTWTVTNGSSYTIQLGTFPGATLGSGMFDLSTVCSGPTYPPACFGTNCPCGNNGDGQGGCQHTVGTGGTILAGSGAASLSGDTFVLTATRTRNAPGIFFQANNLIASPPAFGDGLRCCGVNVVRIGTYLAAGNTTNTDTGNQIGGIGPPVSDHPLNAGLTAGSTRCYQYWHRDPPTGVCGNGFNLSNAVQATWTL